MKKYADIVTKDEFGRNVDEGRAVLLNEMDHTHVKGFWEYRFIDGGVTHCGWIDNDKIFEV